MLGKSVRHAVHIHCFIAPKSFHGSLFEVAPKMAYDGKKNTEEQSLSPVRAVEPKSPTKRVRFYI